MLTAGAVAPPGDANLGTQTSADRAHTTTQRSRRASSGQARGMPSRSVRAVTVRRAVRAAVIDVPEVHIPVLGGLRQQRVHGGGLRRDRRLTRAAEVDGVPEQDPARWASATVEHKWCGVHLRRGSGSGLLDNVFSDTIAAGQEAVVASGGALPSSGEMLLRGLGGGADPLDRPVQDVDDGIGDDGAGAVPDHGGPGGEALAHTWRR